ncbi:MAG: hypothetical protein Q8R79_07115 [Legionellaceae bacterium]|nr:hypothetical protein [Legionellaceae bacterium]
MPELTFDTKITPHLETIECFFQEWMGGTLEQRQELYTWMLSIKKEKRFNHQPTLESLANFLSSTENTYDAILEGLKTKGYILGEIEVNYVLLSAIMTLAENWSTVLCLLVKAFYETALLFNQPDFPPVSLNAPDETGLLSLAQNPSLMQLCAYSLANNQYYYEDCAQRNKHYKKKMAAEGKEIPRLVPPAAIQQRILIPDDLRSWEDWQSIYPLFKTDAERQKIFDEQKMSIITALTVAKVPYKDATPFLPSQVRADGWVEQHIMTCAANAQAEQLDSLPATTPNLEAPQDPSVMPPRAATPRSPRTTAEYSCSFMPPPPKTPIKIESNEPSATSNEPSTTSKGFFTCGCC